MIIPLFLLSLASLHEAASDDRVSNLFDGSFPRIDPGVFQTVEGVERETRGEYGTMDYTATFSKAGEKLSIWMDIPLYVTDSNTSSELVVNFWPEIPRGTSDCHVLLSLLPRSLYLLRPFPSSFLCLYLLFFPFASKWGLPVNLYL